MSAHIRIHPGCRGEIWVLRLICCGRDDGIEGYPTWAEAQAFRESYTNDTTGHDRQAILSVIRPLAIGGES